jgi:hypothetical protein
MILATPVRFSADFVSMRAVVSLVFVVAAALRAQMPNVPVIGNDYAFIHTPDTLTAGQTTFSFENQGKMRHEMSIFLIKEGMTSRDVFDAFSAGGRREAIREKPIGLLIATPGDTSGGRLLVTLLPRRSYAIVCTLRDTPDAKQHVMLGMLTTFYVKPN